MKNTLLPSILIVLALSFSRSLAEETVEDLIQAARKALEKERPGDALTLLDKAVVKEPKNAALRLFRASVLDRLEKYKEALADLDQAIKQDPETANAYNLRGMVHFKLAHIKESIADFDKYLEMKPEATPNHWQRGISYYYSGQYEKGAKQFKGYEKVDADDVENVVWRYLCMARKDGVKKAREGLSPVGVDKRVPMMEIYKLFQGKAKPEDVLDAAKAGKPSAEELTTRLFNAHLYLALYYEAEGDKKNCMKHLKLAVASPKVGGYMGDVARVHLELRKKE